MEFGAVGFYQVVLQIVHLVVEENVAVHPCRTGVHTCRLPVVPHRRQRDVRGTLSLAGIDCSRLAPVFERVRRILSFAIYEQKGPELVSERRTTDEQCAPSPKETTV